MHPHMSKPLEALRTHGQRRVSFLVLSSESSLCTARMCVSLDENKAHSPRKAVAQTSVSRGSQLVRAYDTLHGVLTCNVKGLA